MDECSDGTVPENERGARYFPKTADPVHGHGEGFGQYAHSRIEIGWACVKK